MDTSTTKTIEVKVVPQVHINHEDGSITKKIRAAKAALRFISKTARCSNPENADELRRRVWIIYKRLRRAHLLVAPRMTKSFVIAKFGRPAIVDVSVN